MTRRYACAWWRTLALPAGTCALLAVATWTGTASLDLVLVALVVVAASGAYAWARRREAIVVGRYGIAVRHGLFRPAVRRWRWHEVRRVRASAAGTGLARHATAVRPYVLVTIREPRAIAPIGPFADARAVARAAERARIRADDPPEPE